MAITPIDLINKNFGRKMRGYDTAEVDQFLKEVAEEFEKLLDEKSRLSDRVESLEAEIGRYRDMEGTLNSALVLAQKTADDVKANAKKEADLLAREVRESVKYELEQARNELDELRRAKDRFNREFRALLRSHLETLEVGESAGTTEQPAGR